MSATRRRSAQPTTLLVGGASGPLYHDVIARLGTWLPNAHIVSIDGGDHLLPLRSPERLADIVLDASSCRGPATRLPPRRLE